MSTSYWLVYDQGDPPAGPYSDIHRCREHAVADASDLDCRVQIHRSPDEREDPTWDDVETLVEEW